MVIKVDKNRVKIKEKYGVQRRVCDEYSTRKPMQFASTREKTVWGGGGIVALNSSGFNIRKSKQFLINTCLETLSLPSIITLLPILRC